MYIKTVMGFVVFVYDFMGKSGMWLCDLFV